MAARNRVKDLQAVVNCSICQDYFNDPVILKCGHNFCRACITRYCESVDAIDISPRSYPCPRCREVFREGELHPNPHLRNIVDIAKKIPEPRGRRACKEHGKLLKLFCEVDGTPICLDCRESPTHKDHRVAPADEAAFDYKSQIQFHLDILKKEREVILSFKLSGENTSQELLKQLETEKQKIVSEFQQVRQFLEEQEQLLLAQLEELNKEIEKGSAEYVTKLSEEISSFSSLISEMEQKCQQPANEFLQDIKGTLSRWEREKFWKPMAFSDLKWRIWESSKKNAALETIVKKFKDQKEMSLVRPWLRRRTTRLQDKLSRLSVGAKRASSEEDSDTDQKKRCLPIDSLSHTDSALSALDSQVQEQVTSWLPTEDSDEVTWWLPPEDSDEDQKKRCLPVDSLSHTDSALSALDSQVPEQVTWWLPPEDSDEGKRASSEEDSDKGRHQLSSHRLSPLHRRPSPRVSEQSSLSATSSHMMQASTALRSEQSSSVEDACRELYLAMIDPWDEWASETATTSANPSWQHDQWPYRTGGDVPVTPSSHPSLAATSQQQLASSSSVPKAHSEAGVEEEAHSPKPPPPMGDDAPGPPR
ncbi:tripartite motif-containing protein 10-like [Chrysemys picta bellii]|uniref:tripartite motif-containing protein 10-like n=1 Tax=Chrysemys picta bellii TaxID=8478 RepID=UPI0032B21528